MGRIAWILAGAAALGACASALPIASSARAADMATIRAACAAMGLNPHEAPFDYCVRSLAASAPARPRPGIAPVAISGEPYRAEDACQAIGLDPSTARFSYCVGNLRATIDQSNNVGAR